MNSLIKSCIPVFLAVTVGASALSGNAAPAPAKKPAAPAAAKPAATQPANQQVALAVTPTELLREPKQFLNKNITFEGTFNNFSSVGLDYKRAFRNSKDYVSFMILRPDVTHHTIPLAELKLLYPRKKSEEILHLEPGDKISVKGQVFSTALDEPWVDVSEVKILTKAKPDKDKAKKNEECLGQGC